MSMNNNLENGFLGLFFNGAAMADVAENDTTAPATSVEVNLHTADPGEAGTQATSLTTYTGYAEQTVSRVGAAGFTVTGNSVSPNADITFPECTAAPGADITHASFSIGNFMFRGALSAAIVMAVGTIPRIKAGSTITMD